jgi:hypothetical protein
MMAVGMVLNPALLDVMMSGLDATALPTTPDELRAQTIRQMNAAFGPLMIPTFILQAALGFGLFGPSAAVAAHYAENAQEG